MKITWKVSSALWLGNGGQERLGNNTAVGGRAFLERN